jgi:hypothetical protein
VDDLLVALDSLLHIYVLICFMYLLAFALVIRSIGKWGKAQPRRRSLQGGGGPEPKDKVVMASR